MVLAWCTLLSTVPLMSRFLRVARRRANTVAAALVVLGAFSVYGPGKAPSASATSAPTCKTSSLRATALGNAGLGHGSYIVELRNVTATSCRLSGYPRVVTSPLGPLTGTFSPVFRGSSRLRAVAHDARMGYSGGLNTLYGPLPVVTLAAHTGRASFVIEWIEVSPRKTCRSFARLYVTLPGSMSPIRLDDAGLLCSILEVHPIVKGSTGFLN